MSFGYGTGPSPSGPMVKWQDGQPVPYQPSNANTEQAYNQLYGMTGIPDMQQAYEAYQRGEYLPALGQGAYGAAQAASLAAPAIGGAIRAAGGTRNALGMLGDVLADESGALRLYHGSPHDFDRFRMSKIGTGEGNQTYGHGLYFSEAEPVAMSYRDALATPSAFVGGERVPLPQGSPQQLAVRSLNSPMAGATPQETIANLRKFGLDDAATWLERNHPNLEVRPQGHMYEVNVNVDPNRLLDWDKPLNQQEALQDALGGILMDRWGANPKAYRKIDDELSVLGKRSGGSIYDRLASQAAAEAGNKGYDYPAASRMLLKEGIPGARYLDQGSRAAGQGTYNYSIWNDKLIDILRKYGIVGPAAGAGALALPGEEGGGF